jgi:AAA domain
LQVEEISVLGSSAILGGEEHASNRLRVLGANAANKVLVSKKDAMGNEELNVFASIDEVSALFEYTEDQARAFAIIAAGLLRAFMDNDDAERLTDEVIQAHQAVALIQGLAGSGKSYVVFGWIALSTSWGHPNAVMTCAISGIAAVNVQGRTIASITCRTSEKSRQKMVSKKLLVVDEVNVACGSLPLSRPCASLVYPPYVARCVRCHGL